MEDSNLVLGDKVQDSVTLFTGIMTAKIDYLHGVSQIEITPQIDPAKPSKRPDAEWFRRGRVISLEKN